MAHKGHIFGVFLAPFHRAGDNPTLGIRRDIELVEWLDQLGYDEAWIGEHHSAGWETIASSIMSRWRSTSMPIMKASLGSAPGPIPNMTRPRV